MCILFEELFYILEGSPILILDGHAVELAPGACGVAHVGVAHAWLGPATGSADVVARTEFRGAQFGSANSGSGRGCGSPSPERFVSEDAERAAGGEMALDVETC
jgi:hypothetical protein